MKEFDERLFTRAEDELSVEISSLGAGNPFRFINNYSPTNGLAIRFASDNRSVRYYVSKEGFHRGELTHWELLPLDLPSPVRKIYVYND